MLLALLLVVTAQASEPYQDEIERLRSSYTVRAVVAPRETPLSRDMADFLLDRPDLAAFLARRRKIAAYAVSAKGHRQWHADDKDGTQGTVTLVESDGTRRLYYGEGAHRSPAFPIIRATALVVMQVETVQKEGCPAAVKSGFEVYIRLRNPVLSNVVKALRPFLRGLIARKFERAFLAAHEVGALLAKEPGQVLSQAREFPALGADLARFEALVAQLPQRPAACLEPSVKTR